MNEKKRFNYLDAVKGVGMYGIVSQHIITGLNDPFNLWLATIKIICFFMVTGMLMRMRESQLTFKEFAIKRFSSIMIPYFIFSLLIIISDFVISGFKMSVLAVDVVNTVILRGAGAIWFLPVFYLGSLLFYLIKNNSAIKLFILSVMLLAVSYLLGLVVSEFDTMGSIFKLVSRIILVLGKTFMSTAYISLGYIAYDKFIEKTNLLIGALSLILSVAFAQFSKSLDLNFLDFSTNPIMFLFASVLGVIGLTIILKELEIRFRLQYKVLSYLSINSLLIMSTHYYYNIIPFARNISNKFDGIIAYIIAVVIVLIIEIIIVEVVNRTKLKKILHI